MKSLQPDASALSYTAEYQIRTYEIDRNKEATVPALIQLMQEAAMQNVIELNLSVWDLEPHHISWVLMKQKMEFKRIPKLGDKIKVYTCPTGFEKFFTYRDYIIYDADNQPIVTVATTWLLMDTNTRRMTRIPDFIRKFDIEKEDHLPRVNKKLPKFERVDFERQHEVSWYDLDFNEHLNNTVYFQWMLEDVPDEVLLNKKLSDLQIQFRMEGRWREQIVSQVQHLSENEYLHQLIRKEDGKELASALTKWT
ncbi:MAG: acyl-[acyl-carrier-protein] thioesterase [Saprospiraceae bacterium]